MKEYIINYKEKRNTEGTIFETSVTANSVAEARKYARNDLKDYTVVSVRLA